MSFYRVSLVGSRRAWRVLESQRASELIHFGMAEEHTHTQSTELYATVANMSISSLSYLAMSLI